MFCKKCGKEIEDNAKFCQYCGQEVDSIVINNTGSNIQTKKFKIKDNDSKLKLILSIIAFIVIIWILIVRLVPEEFVKSNIPQNCDSNEVKTLLKDIYINNTEIATDNNLDDIQFEDIAEVSSNENYKSCSAKVLYKFKPIGDFSAINKRCEISYVVKTPDLLHVSVTPNFYSNLKIINNCSEYFSSAETKSNSNTNNENKRENIEYYEAEEFSNAIKQITMSSDIANFANLIQFPIEIGFISDNTSIKIYNKEQFIALGADRIFTDEFKNNVCNEELFHNYAGYMMGSGPNLWFDNVDSGSLKIYSMTISK